MMFVSASRSISRIIYDVRTERPAAKTKVVMKPSQLANVAHSLRLQVALDEAARAGRADRIKRLREESAYTQPALAEAVGVTLRAYQRWEEGGGIEWEHLEKLAEIHGVSVQWLHRGEERATPDVLGALSSSELLAELRSLRAELLAELSAVRTTQERLLKLLPPDERGEAERRK